MLATPLSYTISAASVPAILNSRSAYFFQYPKSRGNFARNLSNALRVRAIACGDEFRLRPPPPSIASQARISFSHASKSSESSSYIARELGLTVERNTYSRYIPRTCLPLHSLRFRPCSWSLGLHSDFGSKPFWRQ